MDISLVQEQGKGAYKLRMGKGDVGALGKGDWED